MDYSELKTSGLSCLDTCRLTFRATEAVSEYDSGMGMLFRDGRTRIVSVEVAKNLLHRFPKNFSADWLDDAPDEAPDSPDEAPETEVDPSLRSELEAMTKKQLIGLAMNVDGVVVSPKDRKSVIIDKILS